MTNADIETLIRKAIKIKKLKERFNFLKELEKTINTNNNDKRRS